MTAPGSSDRDFIAALTAALSNGAAAQLRWGGRVTQVSPLRVDVGGSGVPVACARLSSYSPAVDDLVVLVQQGRQYLALGTFVPSS